MTDEIKVWVVLPYAACLRFVVSDDRIYAILPVLMHLINFSRHLQVVLHRYNLFTPHEDQAAKVVHCRTFPWTVVHWLLATGKCH